MAAPILITGAHRSGTTWVAKIICSSPGIQYVHEPFNVDYKGHDIRPDHWFQYITRENEAPFYEHIKKMATPKITPAAEKTAKPRSHWLPFASPPPRVLIKDPIAVFSAEWLASRFTMDVVLLIRHPAAFVESICTRNWTHDFSHFLRQPLLMAEHLSPFKEEIVRFADEKHDIFDQAILLWKLIYYMVSKYRLKHADWLFVRHEDICADPAGVFRMIFRNLDIAFNRATKKIVEEYSDIKNPVAGDVHSIKRNSQAIIKKWKDNFSPLQIKNIRDAVEPIAKEFYSDKDW